MITNLKLIKPVSAFIYFLRIQTNSQQRVTELLCRHILETQWTSGTNATFMEIFQISRALVRPRPVAIRVIPPLIGTNIGGYTFGTYIWDIHLGHKDYGRFNR